MLCAAASVLLSVTRQWRWRWRRRRKKNAERKCAQSEAFHSNGVVSERALNCLVSHYILFSQRRPACPGGSFGSSFRFFPPLNLSSFSLWLFSLIFFFALFPARRSQHCTISRVRTTQLKMKSINGIYIFLCSSIFVPSKWGVRKKWKK